jgi:hypothetical protein
MYTSVGSPRWLVRLGLDCLHDVVMVSLLAFVAVLELKDGVSLAANILTDAVHVGHGFPEEARCVTDAANP